MEILFRGIAKKTGQPVIGYHLKMLNENGEMVDKIYKNCGYDKEEWGFMEIEPGSLEVFVEGKTLFNSLQEIESLTQKDLDLHPINFGNDNEPISTDWKTIAEDGLPPVGSCLIVTIKNHGYGGRRELRYPIHYLEKNYAPGYAFYMNGTDILLPEYSEVVAWMPLPMPYDGE